MMIWVDVSDFLIRLLQLSLVLDVVAASGSKPQSHHEDTHNPLLFHFVSLVTDYSDSV